MYSLTPLNSEHEEIYYLLRSACSDDKKVKLIMQKIVQYALWGYEIGLLDSKK